MALRGVFLLFAIFRVAYGQSEMLMPGTLELDNMQLSVCSNLAVDTYVFFLAESRQEYSNSSPKIVALQETSPFSIICRRGQWKWKWLCRQ